MGRAWSVVAAVGWTVLVAVGVFAVAEPARAADPYRPKTTLAEDLEGLNVPLVEGYMVSRPRLLFGPGDRETLRAKAVARPELWDEVLASAKRWPDVPEAKEIRSGGHYWRIERVESAALAWFVTGEEAYKKTAVDWMVAHCREDVWGDGDWRPNIDLFAAWFLYHIGIAYDILHDQIAPADREVIRKGLANHARAIYESLDPAKGKKFTYDQNHAYIPTIGMTTAALALLGEVPEADEWVRRGYAMMRRCRYALGDDGYYYEGLGYWSYALHWHVRYAELMNRATGQNLFNLSVLRENWRFALYLSLPGVPNGFDVGDTGIWSGTEIPEMRLGNVGMYWAVAAATGSRESRLVGDTLSKRWPSTDYPASAFMWFTDRVAPADLDKLPTWHYFTDHGVVSWRSGWDAGDTAALFRLGPPLGHRAAKKLGEMTDWSTNCGHVHPDIGSVWLYAHGQYMASDTGYLAEKYTRDHNTLLVDGKGQGIDGSYHNEQGYPYEQFDKARLDRVRFTDHYGYATGEFGSVYRATPEVSLRRTVVVTRHWLLTVDRLRDDEPHTLTWLMHAIAPFERREDTAGWIADYGQSRMLVVPLDTTAMLSEADKSIVQAGTGPGKPAPTHRGYHLQRTTAAAAADVHLAHLLVPLAKEAAPPKVRPVELTAGRLVFELEPPEGKRHRITILLPSDDAEAPAGEGELVTIEIPEE